MTIPKHLIGACLMLLSVSTWGAGFNDNGDGTITDFATGLIWQQSDAHNSSERTHAQAIDYCNGLNLAGNGNWRLPEIKELSSIIDYRRSSPSIDLAYFPTTNSVRYWSASSDANDSSRAWFVIFSHGFVNAGNKTITDYVRCVR